MAYLVVGLGNPGPKYAKTRHNIGFMVAEELASLQGITFVEKDDYAIAKGELEGAPLFIIKPLTFMNLSGRAVRNFLRYNNIPGDNLFVVYDDLDMPLGKVRLKWNGSGGGHKGVQSIINELQSKEFYHLKIGISKPLLKELVEGYVLTKFSPEEKKVIDEAIKRAVLSLKTAMTEGASKAMTLYNG